MHDAPPSGPRRVAALVKQIPAFEAMALGPDGRLDRGGLPSEMSAYCRRAVAEAVLLVGESGGHVTVITMGPPSAVDVLREAIAYGTGLGGDARLPVAIRGVLVSDPAFAGSDTLATARALAAAIRRFEGEDGPFDLVLCGRSSVDADTGQVPPELAELLDRPFVTGVKVLDDRGATIDVGCELDDVWQDATVTLPAVVSVAERLIDPCKVKDPAIWAGVDPASIVTVTAADLGAGPWGQAGSPTSVGEIRTEAVHRAGRVLSGSIDEQVDEALAELADRGLLRPPTPGPTARALTPLAATVPAGRAGTPIVAVVAEPGRDRATRELVGAAARLASPIGGTVAVVGPPDQDPDVLATWGADAVHHIVGSTVEEDVAPAVRSWAEAHLPWGILVGGTAWGREVASRVAAGLGAGLTGDAVGLGVDDGRLLAWKPAFGGALVAAVRSSSPVQLVTVRAGVLARHEPRAAGAEPVPVSVVTVVPRGRVVVHERRREDDADALAEAEVVVGIGQGIAPEDHPKLAGLCALLGAELACTRKVTDKGWLPHARQLGITGRSISPRLYVAIATSGKFNHMAGVRSAGTILAINPDPGAPVFGFADVGIVGPWGEVVPRLEARWAAAIGHAASSSPSTRPAS